MRNRLNNCRWVLLERMDKSWVRVHRGRGPHPRTFSDGSAWAGRARHLCESDGDARECLCRDVPDRNCGDLIWHRMTRNSRDCFHNGKASQVSASILIAASPQMVKMESSWCCRNIGYTHCRSGRSSIGMATVWQQSGKLRWPIAEYSKPVPVRLCYPNVAICNRAVHFLGVGDIVEPNEAMAEIQKVSDWQRVGLRLSPALLQLDTGYQSEAIW